MKLLFATASEPNPRAYPHRLEIAFSKDKVAQNSQWTLLGKPYNNIEDWTVAVQRTALSFGISDFECFFPEKNSDDQEPLSLEFHFKSRIEFLQFCLITGATPPERTNSLTLSSPDRYHCKRRMKNIHHFASQYEIPVSLYQLSPSEFKVVTNNVADLLAIETHLEKGQFDKGPLLSFTKPILLDPEFWPSQR